MTDLLTAEGFTCTVPGCRAFPFDTAAERDWHVGHGQHVTDAEIAAIYDGTPTGALAGSEPRPAGQGTGTGKAKADNLATEKQVAFLTRLIAERPTAAAERHTGAVETLTKAQASNLIEALLALPKENGPAAPAADGPAEYRWAKVGDEWLARGPQARSGDRIVITKADGSTADAVVVEPWPHGEGLHRVRRAYDAQANAPKVDLEAGKVYTTADGRFVKVTLTRAGRQIGKVRLDEGGWEYVPGVLKHITGPVTAEQAAAWGHDHDRCVFCGRDLTDDGAGRSVEVGYGPVCAEKHGLPWG